MPLVLIHFVAPRRLGKSTAYDVVYRDSCTGERLYLRCGSADIPTQSVRRWLRPDDWNRPSESVTPAEKLLADQLTTVWERGPLPGEWVVEPYSIVERT